MLQRLAAALFAAGEVEEARKLLGEAALIADEMADGSLKMACENLEENLG